MTDYSTAHISQPLIEEIVQALRTVNQYGSVEIYVQNSTVTQITIRNIRKTSVAISHRSNQKKVDGTVPIISHVQS